MISLIAKEYSWKLGRHRTQVLRRLEQLRLGLSPSTSGLTVATEAINSTLTPFGFPHFGQLKEVIVPGLDYKQLRVSLHDGHTAMRGKDYGCLIPQSH